MGEIAQRVCCGCFVSVVSALLVSTASAMEVKRSDTRYVDREYHLDLDVILDATPERVEAVLRDYANYPRLGVGILESKILSRPTTTTAVLYTKLRACSGLYCRTVKRVENVQEGAFELLAVVVPEQSDVVSGRTHTVLQSFDGRTRVQYQSSINPKFWVPSLIGRPLMLRTLREASLDLFRHVEAQAKQ